MPVRRRPLTLQAPLTPYQERLNKQDYTVCAYAFSVTVVAVASYLSAFFLDLNKERAEWEERRGGKAPPQRPRKDIPVSRIYLVFYCLGSMYCTYFVRLLEFHA